MREAIEKRCRAEFEEDSLCLSLLNDDKRVLESEKVT